MAKDMTKGSIAQALITFSIPLSLSGLLQQLYSWADAFIVGNIEGESALAAIGATTVIVNLFTMAINGFTSGVSILAGQRFGAGEREIQKKILFSFVLILGVVSLVLCGTGITFMDHFLVLLKTPEDIYELSKGYIQIIMLGVPFMAVYNVYSAVLRGIGDSKAPFYSVMVSSAANVVLDILFVGSFGWHVEGAAAATILSQIMMTVFIVVYSMKKYEIMRFRPDKSMFDKNVVKDGTALALPITIQWVISSLGSLALQNFMNSFGTVTVAAISTAYRVDSVIMLPVVNHGTGIATVTSQNVGAGDEKRAKRCLYVGTGIMAVTSIVLTLFVTTFGGSLIGLFGVTEECKAIGAEFFRCIAMFYIVFGTSVAVRGYLQGNGEVLLTGIIGILCMVVRIALSYLLRPIFRNMVIAYAEAFAWCFQLIMYLGQLAFFVRSRKKEGRKHGI